MLKVFASSNANLLKGSESYHSKFSNSVMQYERCMERDKHFAIFCTLCIILFIFNKCWAFLSRFLFYYSTGNIGYYYIFFLRIYLSAF